MPDKETLIRERAYAIWEQAGRPAGRDEDHWFQAMRELSLPPVPKPGTVTRLRQAAKAAAKTTTKKERV